MLGGAAAPVIAGYLIGWIGWRWTFAVFGAVGVVWAAAFYWWFRDSPAEHADCNAAEAELIAASAATRGGRDGDSSIPWKIVLASPNMWFLGCIMISSATLWGLMNSMGGVGVIATTSLVGWYVASREKLGTPPLECWNPVFEGVGLVLLAGAAIWLFVDPTRSIVERVSPEDARTG